MRDMLEVQSLMINSNFFGWLLANLSIAILFASLDVVLFVKIFKSRVSKWQIITGIATESIARIVINSVIPFPYNRAIILVLTVMIFKFVLNEKIEKCTFGKVINAIIVLLIELIYSKVFWLIHSDSMSYSECISSISYRLSIAFWVFIFRAIILFIIIKKDIGIILSPNLSKKNRCLIVLICIIGCMLIYFNAAEMVLFISNFPYTVFWLDIISLIVYFYISMKDIIRLSKLEEMYKKVENLESYNKTLTIMYDSIRGFRHDFNNFIQALDGYVETNNIEGIRQMNNEVLSECKEINNLGILDPKIINNPAVYSIITNKYYKAQEENIRMNMEIMLDFNDLNISTYELCRILGILLDNAIEAAKMCEKKIINIQVRKDFKVKRNLIIIENTYKEQNINIDKIYEKGYSTKNADKDSHGLGLWNIRRILQKNNNLNLFTTTKEKLFSQQLEIY